MSSLWDRQRPNLIRRDKLPTAKHIIQFMLVIGAVLVIFILMQNLRNRVDQFQNTVMSETDAWKINSSNDLEGVKEQVEDIKTDIDKMKKRWGMYIFT